MAASSPAVPVAEATQLGIRTEVVVAVPVEPVVRLHLATQPHSTPAGNQPSLQEQQPLSSILYRPFETILATLPGRVDGSWASGCPGNQAQHDAGLAEVRSSFQNTESLLFRAFGVFCVVGERVSPT